MFLEEAEEAVQALIRGLPPDAIESQLHFLKGSALNLGLAELAALCQDGERKAAQGLGAEVDTDRVADVYAASRAELMGGLAQGRAA